MQVYKINYICLNQDKSQFCLCYNDGIKLYNLKPLYLLSTSNSKFQSLGDISIATLFYRTQNVAFVGSTNNLKYYPKKLVLWDNISKSEINSQVFLSKIINLKSIKNLIYSQTESKIYIISLIEKNMQIINTLCTKSNVLEILWDKNQNHLISFVSDKNPLCFNVINALSNNYLFEEKSSGFQNGIQTIIFCENINSIFIIDQSGKFINGYSIKEGNLICSLYRGNNPATITSLTAFNNDYLCITGSTKTIHLFQINNEKNEANNDSWQNLFSLKQKIFNLFGFNKSKIKINLQSKTLSYFDNDFNRKGSILFYDNDTLNCLSYNGNIYKIIFDFDKLSYKIEETLDWHSIEEVNEDVEVSVFEFISIDEEYLKKQKDKWILTNK